ncbi:LLM class flavin-dependent oxidoreductase [Actinomadura sp. 1N219]|uniref:LLM class flavin-dependent oxidoreductase n=1 Tax=Actinomadura sp. 1N219 TaxID=3375152 RepID=UPI0037931C1C
MRFSIYLNTGLPGPDDDLDTIDTTTAQAVLADQHGFAGVCIGEHAGGGGDPFLFAAFLAPQIYQAQLVLRLAEPTLRDRIRCARSRATLDLLTRGGCLIGGPAAGSLEGTTLREGDSDEAIIATARDGRALLTHCGTVGETARAWVLYNAAFDRAGHPETTTAFARTWTMARALVYVGDTDASAADEVPWMSAEPARTMIVGGPDTVARAIEEHRAAGIGHLLLSFRFGRLNPALAGRSLRCFIDEVLPRFTHPVQAAESLAASAIAQG